MKIRLVLLLLLSACLFLVLTGCGSQEPEDIIEDTVGELMDAQNEAIREEAHAHRTYGEDDDSVEIFSSKWPKEIPKEFVEFKYGTHLQTVLHLEEDGNWTIIHTATRDDIKHYEEDLAKFGWVNDDSFNDSPDVISYDLDGLNTFIHIGDDVPGENTSYITLYLDLGADINENQAMKEEEMIIEKDDLSHAISGDIPDGYPEDFCPIYEPSFVEMGVRSEDEDFIGYILGAYTVDEFEKVKSFYSALDPQETTDMGFGKVFVFESENGIDYASVTVMDWQDLEDEELKDFKTSISISISLGK